MRSFWIEQTVLLGLRIVVRAIRLESRASHFADSWKWIAAVRAKVLQSSASDTPPLVPPIRSPFPTALSLRVVSSTFELLG